MDVAPGRGPRVPPAVLDAGLAALVALLSAADLARAAPAGEPTRPADVWGLALVGLTSLPLAARRRAPRWVLAVVLVAAALLSVGGYRQSSFALGLVVALYSVGTQVAGRAAVPLLAASAGLLVLAYAVSPVPVTVADVVQSSLSLAVAWWLGTTMRLRAAYAAASAERAELLHRIHHETAANAVAHERLRIARELHDVVAHSMSVVSVQSGVAMHLLDSRPDQARAAVGAIVGASRSALDELRRLLGVLRQDGREGELAPSPALTDVPDLAAAVTAAGVPVELRLPRPPPQVPAAVALSAYRIVQEALTNTVKHAGPGAAAVVSVDVRDGPGGQPRTLVLRVEDHGGRPAGAAAPPGVGLTGMWERVALFGGTLETGPTRDGFAVAATLPLPAGPRTPAGGTLP